MKDIKSPNKTIREIASAICVLLFAAGIAVFFAIKTAWRWIGLAVSVICIVVIIILWISYSTKNKQFKQYVQDNIKIQEELTCDPKPDNGLTPNFSWIVDVPKIQGSPIQFSNDDKLLSSLKCLEEAREDINYIKDLEKYKDIELNNINIYIRQTLEWALKFIKFNDPNFKKWKTYFTIFDGQKISFDTDFIIDESRGMTTQWVAKNVDHGIYSYVGTFQTGKTFYAKSYKHLKGREAITKWHRDETTGAPFIDKWSQMYPNDHVVALIKDVCLDIYRTTSKVVHASDDTRKTINIVYAKYYKDENVSDKAKALLVAKAMFHQTHYVLWYVANKYSLYETPFKNTDISVYKQK